MAKNLKINIKNSQLAAVLKQNQTKKEEKSKPSEKEEVVSELATSSDKGAAQPQKRKAKKLPSGVVTPQDARNQAHEPSLEDAEHVEPKEVVKEIKKSDLTKEISKESEPEHEKPIAQANLPTPQPHAKPAPVKTEEPPKLVEADVLVRKREEPIVPPREQKKPTNPDVSLNEEEDEDFKKEKSKGKFDKKKGAASEKKPLEDKGKKGNLSYRRQAFSRVFDSRSTSRDDDIWRRRRHGKLKSNQSNEPIVRPTEVTVKLPISVKDLAATMKLKGTDVIQKLFLQGLPITINDTLEDPTTVELIGSEFGCKVTIDTSKEERLQVTEKSIKEEIEQTDSAKLVTRPPVVTIMGHVDHGKTSIIDSFRKSNIASGEAGAITQHIGAFSCKTKHGSFTVLDTPGHEAFSAIRARGANVTDIVVLVVAGDEGIKPQTEEAIQKATDANVPIIVAINKKDKPGFNQDEIYRQLADRNLLPEAWGGEIITINCSAKTGEGIDALAEMIALQSDVLELKADPSARARGTVLESELHRGLGSSATLLIQNGTLRIGDAVIFEYEYGRVKTMQDEHGEFLKEAGPSTAVKITGLSGVPSAGNDFISLSSEKEARKIAEDRKTSSRHTQLRKSIAKDVEHLMQQKVDRQQKKLLSIILKADVGGSVEAVREMIFNIPTDKVEVNFISTSVGQVSESDIELADASGAIIVGFHTSLESHAESLVKRKKVKIFLHDVIYHLVDDVKAHMLTLLDKVRKENQVGEAKVLATFKSSQLGLIAGSQVTDGLIKRSHFVRVFRDDAEVWHGAISSLKRHQDDAKEVKKDLECGILLNGFTGIKAGDIIKSYEVTYETQEL